IHRFCARIFYVIPEYVSRSKSPTHTYTLSLHDALPIFEVAGNCAMCKQRIEKAAKINGVSQATWNTQDRTAIVVFNPDVTSSKNIKQSIADAGHDTDETRAKQEVYEELHQCCLYDRLGEEKNINEHDDDQHNHDHEHVVRGVVVQENNRGDLTPIAGVNVHRLENKTTQKQCNEEGVFDIKHEKGYRHLVVSYA